MSKKNMANGDVEIIEEMITSCEFCDIEPPKIPQMQDDPDGDGQIPVVDSEGQPVMVRDIDWQGVAGYHIRSHSSYEWSDADDNHICKSCMNKLIKGVTIMNQNKLGSVGL